MHQLFKRMSWFFISVSLLLSQVAFAQTVNPTKLGDYFKIAPKDTSMVLLKRIFGNTGLPALAGEKGIFNTMFQEFNEAMFAFLMIILLYTVLTSIVNSATAGEFLLTKGKKPSLWTPARIVAALVLVLPTKTGYSIIQIFMLWVVTQGIGAADHLWEATISYLKSGESVIAPVATFDLIDGPAAMSFMRGTVCMHRQFQKSTVPERKFEDDSLMPQIIHDEITKSGQKKNYVGYVFSPSSPIPGMPDPLYDGCGKILWPTVDSVTGTDTSSQELKAKYQALETSIPQAIMAMNTSSKIYVFNGSKPITSTGLNPVEIFRSSVSNAVRDSVMEVVNQSKGGGPEDQFWQEVIDYGWANAGAYFLTIANTNDRNSSNTHYVKDLEIYARSSTKGSGDPSAQPRNLQKQDSDFIEQLGRDANRSLVPARTAPSGSGTGSSGQFLSSALESIGKPIISLFSLMIFGQADVTGGGIGYGGSADTAYFTNQTVHPVVKIQAIGNRIIDIIVVVWAGLMLVYLVAAGIAYICSSSSPAWGVVDFLFRLTAVPLMLLFGLVFASALSMSAYVPLIPYIIYFFGVMGWMIAVIESVIATPIVTIGLAHPEGDHEIFGRAEPAIQLIMNLFFRPSLMIFGMMAGMVISYVAVNFMSLMYGGVIKAGNVAHGPFQDILYIVIYISLVLAILNKCFALIHTLPDTVLKWLNWQSQFGEYGRGGLEEVKGGFGGGVAGLKEGQAMGRGALSYMEAATKEAGPITARGKAKKEEAAIQKGVGEELIKEKVASRIGETKTPATVTAGGGGAGAGPAAGAPQPPAASGGNE